MQPTTKIPLIKGLDDTISSTHVMCLPQVKEDCNKVLAHEEIILDIVLLVHVVVKGGFVALKPRVNTHT